MSNAVSLGFPDAVARVKRNDPRAFAKPQYVEYNSPQNGNNILYGTSEFSDFHDRARSDMLIQLENKKRDEEARMKRFLMGNPMPKLPMNSWSSAGRPYGGADKFVAMSDYASALRGGTQPNYTPEALEIQRKMLKRRANEAGVISRNELPPPTMKPKKTFAESLADVINTVLLSLEDAVGSGNYGSINAGDIYKLFRSLSENGYVFESKQLEEFKANIDSMMEDLEGVANSRVPTSEAKGAKLLLNAFDRVSNVLNSLLKNSGVGMEQRKLAARTLVARVKKEDVPPFVKSQYDDMMESVFAEMEDDRGTVIPRNFAGVGELPMDVYREEGEETFDPYAQQFAGASVVPSEARTSSSVRRMIDDDMANYAFQEAALRGDFDASEEMDVAPRLPVPRNVIVAPVPEARSVAPVPDLVRFPQQPQYRGINIPLRQDIPSDMAGLQAFARSIGYVFDPATKKGNLKRGVIAKIRKDLPEY